MNANSEAILGACHPVLIERVHNLAAALEAEGFDPHIDQGLRTVAEQDALWQRGRDADGNVIGPTFTDARGTQSNHVMGWAADFFFEVDAEIDWASAGFDRLVALAPTYGLRSGAGWGDRPHVELPEFPTVPTALMQQTYLEGGVAAVWAAFPLSS